MNGCTAHGATALLRESPSCHLGLVPWLCGSRSGLNPPPDPAYALVEDFPRPSCPVLVLPKISRLHLVLMHTNMHFPIYHILYMYSADQEQFHLVPILSETHAVSSVFSEFSLVNKLLNSIMLEVTLYCHQNTCSCNVITVKYKLNCIFLLLKCLGMGSTVAKE